jgi:hypothetical protein
MVLMKGLKTLFTISLVSIFCTLGANAQKLDRPEPLAGDASLQRSHLWLKDNLGKYGSDGSLVNRSLSKVKVDGCELGYRFRTSTFTGEASFNNPPGISSYAPPTYVSGYGANFHVDTYRPASFARTIEDAKYSFDLKRIAIDSIRLVPVGNTNMVRLAALYEPTSEDLDKLKDLYRTSFYKRHHFTLKLIDDKYLERYLFSAPENIAGQLKDGFTQTARLCQAERK